MFDTEILKEELQTLFYVMELEKEGLLLRGLKENETETWEINVRCVLQPGSKAATVNGEGGRGPNETDTFKGWPDVNKSSSQVQSAGKENINTSWLLLFNLIYTGTHICFRGPTAWDP